MIFYQKSKIKYILNVNSHDVSRNNKFFFYVQAAAGLLPRNNELIKKHFFFPLYVYVATLKCQVDSRDHEKPG